MDNPYSGRDDECQKLSSRYTLLYKFVLPLFHICALFMVLSALMVRIDLGPYTDLLQIVIWIVICIIVLYRSLRLKVVELDGMGNIIISNHLTRAVVPLAEVVEVRESISVVKGSRELDYIQVRFADAIRYGRSITFLPDARNLKGAPSHPAAEALRVAVMRAGGMLNSNL